MYNFRRFLTATIKRFYSVTPQTSSVLEPLNHRSLVRVSGQDVAEFLQGIITNDIRHLEHGSGSMFTMLLNTKGRVLYDTIIYRGEDYNSFLVECDTEVTDNLIKHLKLYRVRRKIDIENVKDSFWLYVLFNKQYANQEKCVEVPIAATKIFKDLQIFKDPRVGALGSRILADPSVDVQKQLSEICEITNNSEVNYRQLRYSFGIGEGIHDLPPGNCFPLECNCDYLHGVSFHKGCYIGQELTARTHHTGVIRKRYMPLFFTKKLTKFPVDNTILHEGKNLGKLRGVEGDVGLGLIRVSQALEFGEITVGDGLAKVVKPTWWPLEATKEKIAPKNV